MIYVFRLDKGTDRERRVHIDGTHGHPEASQIDWLGVLGRRRPIMTDAEALQHEVVEVARRIGRAALRDDHGLALYRLTSTDTSFGCEELGFIPAGRPRRDNPNDDPTATVDERRYAVYLANKGVAVVSVTGGVATVEGGK